MCTECGDERQPVLRSVPEGPWFSRILPAIAGLLHRRAVRGQQTHV
jgi:hypothetical protein